MGGSRVYRSKAFSSMVNFLDQESIAPPNNNIVINVFNNLDEPLLLHGMNGIQQRKNSWQDGLPGTNCPIQPGTNFTYRFQVKDQIGTYFYFPSLGMQRAAGGIGGLRVNSRLLIPVPFDDPEDDYTVLIGDWYKKSHTVLKKKLDSGIGFVNVGIKSSLNFRIQGHTMKLVELEGSHTVQNPPLGFLKQVYTAKRIIVTPTARASLTRILSLLVVGFGLSINSVHFDGTSQQVLPDLTLKIIFENHEKSIQSWHLNGYSFFAVAMEPGRWNPDKRKNYNLLDAVKNVGEELLGTTTLRKCFIPARSLRDEYNIPDVAELCGIVKGLPKPQPYTI
ncbi:L-ascorbate oxidase-like [Vitis vinifera]|uniref:L-ascorbate oxidase-like n=1 Tax=Vitis vinifera TaxID=29760 RepID=A0A438JVS8_VITVI|nr:L-ascorbate oxidase-like [Vitis vinifera]